MRSAVVSSVPQRGQMTRVEGWVSVMFFALLTLENTVSRILVQCYPPLASCPVSSSRYENVLAIANPVGFPVVAALTAAVLIATNDPAAVDRVLVGNPAPPGIRSLLEGESLFNSILALALHVERHDASLRDGISFLEGFIYFVQLFSGGILVGFLVGLSGWLVLHFVRVSWFRAGFGVVVDYASWLLGERLAGVSGVVALLQAPVIRYLLRCEVCCGDDDVG